ncbi:XVIPCD domain-containing protein [Xanthomonas populi]|uniref:X-Tfes XVIPCD domain-containing protein n=1 Tax=Xanthomonas populi TaxID=53414 RepID=A0A2S7EYP9_9XANT|nr:XVIPCD domain-containing protein [Xanthomonas populi]PPU98295.1 hypothetical protein XpopCFBP1817_04270 [Xanthomonas populi]
MERNGLDLGTAKTFTMTAGRQGGRDWVRFKKAGEVTNPSPATAPERSRSSESSATSSLSRADQTLLEQIRGKVGEVDKANGRTFDETSERMCNSLLATAKDGGMTRVDHVFLSNQTDKLPAAHQRPRNARPSSSSMPIYA